MERGSPRILLVDDDSLLREALADFLSSEGFSVVQAGTAVEALRVIQQEPLPDAMVVDLLMPRVGGEELVGLCRQHRMVARIPVVVLSALALTAKQVERLGVSAFLTKPTDASELVRTLRRLATGPEAEPASPSA